MNQLGQSLKQRAFQMASRAQELDESDADLSSYQPGRVSLEDSYMKDGSGVSVKESLNFDPETSEVKSYHYLVNVKSKNEAGETFRQQYQMRLSAADSWMIGSEGETKLEHVAGETWYEEGIGYEGSDHFQTVLQVPEDGQARLIADSRQNGVYGSDKQSVEGFIIE